MTAIRLRILNFIYLALAAFSIVWFVITPFVKVDLTITMDAEIVNNLGLSSTLDTGLSSLGISVDQLLEDGPIELPIKLELTRDDLINVWKVEEGKEKEYIRNDIVIHNVDKSAEALKPQLTKIAKKAAKEVIKGEVEKQLIDNCISSGSNLYKELEAQNLTEKDLSDSVGKVVDKLTEGGHTVTEVSTTLAEEYNKYAVALGGDEMSLDGAESLIEDSLKEYNLINEDGTINAVDDAIEEILKGLLGGLGGGEGENGKAEASLIALRKMTNPMYEGEEPSVSDISITIADTLDSLIDNKLTEDGIDIRNGIMWGLKGAGIALCVFILGWAIKVLQVLIKTFTKKPYIHHEIIGILSAIVQCVLGLVSLLFLLATTTDLTFIKDIPVVGEQIYPYLTIFKGEFAFSAMIPAACCIANLIVSILYGCPKRRMKREIREARRNSKAAA